MFAFIGSHRSGKTTTARAVAERMGIEFLETRVADVFKDAGVDPKADMPFVDRLVLQNQILRAMEVAYELRAGKAFVADRSPFDVLGYTYADIQRGSIPPELRPNVVAHYQYAKGLISKHLRAVILLAPLRDAPDAPTSAQACPFYMDHHYLLVKGLMDAMVPLMADVIGAESYAYDLADRVEEGVGLFTHVKSLMEPEVKLWTPSS